MQVFKEKDLSKNVISGSRVAILGYGNQGHAHALNLKDSGEDVVIGARKAGAAWKKATSDGFVVREISEAVSASDIVVMLLPDEVQAEVFAESVRPNLKPGATLVFAHGFAITFGWIQPPGDNDVVLVAPKGQGHYLRKLYREGSGLPCLIAVENDASGFAKEKALSYAAGIGCLRTGAIWTEFREETVTDLFGEQVVLCGGVPALVKTAFDTLVGRGYLPEIAYLECLHELKIITDLMAKGGVNYMRERISGTAAWGSCLVEETVASADLKKEMHAILDSIENGTFADGWRRETQNDKKRLKEYIHSESEHPIEEAGRSIRSLALLPEEDD